MTALWLALALALTLVPTAPMPAPAQEDPLTVDSTGDDPDLEPGDGSCLTAAETCTLRAAIQEANASEGADVINFESPMEISVVELALPQITDQVTIDGSAHIDETGAPQVVVKRGAEETFTGPGFLLGEGSSGSMIRNLQVRDFGGDGIQILSASIDNDLVDNRIHSNGQYGIFFSPTETDSTSLNTVSGNFIGTADGDTESPNLRGIFVSGGNNQIVNNLISGNTEAGLIISGTSATGNVIKTNRIGTDFTGGAALGNGTSGILVQSGATGNFIGTDAEGQVGANVISANTSGITISGADGNTVSNNLIGTDSSGLLDLGNNGTGIRILSADGNVMVSNVISGNQGYGVLIEGSGLNVLDSNFIGIKASGDAAVPNRLDGVRIADGPDNTLTDNVISGNGGEGIRIEGTNAFNNQVRNNYVGTDVSGLAAVGNGLSGIYIRRAPQNQVIANVVSGNGGFAGIAICGNPTFCGGGDDPNATQSSNAAGNVVQQNLVGLDADGAGALGNIERGVSIDGAPSTEISGNTIANNGFAGVRIVGNEAVGNRVFQNSIHSNGGLGIDLGDIGVTPNDDDDLDTGPNELQNFPVLSHDGGSTLTAFVDANAATGAPYDFELFQVSACDTLAHGEGETLVDSVQADADESGDVTASFSVTEPGIYTSTVSTALEGNTSEFSECVTVESVNTPPVAEDDAVDVARGTDAFVDVLANDSDPDEDSIFIVDSSTEDADCSSSAYCVYSPPGFETLPVQDLFDYTISDDIDTSSATVTVDIHETFGAEGTAATIDGVLDSEWDSADTFDVLVSDGVNEGLGRVFLMNDGENLYFALEVSGISTDDPLVEIRFDENGDGIFSDREDALRLSRDLKLASDVFTDGYYAFDVDVGNRFFSDSSAESSNDGEGVSRSSDGVTVFEMSHPLSTGSVYDLGLLPGDTVAFQIEARFTNFLGDGSSGITVVPGDGGTLDWTMAGTTGTVEVTAITDDEGDDELEAGYAVPLADFPPERLVEAATTIAGAPMAAIDLDASPMAAIPMAAIPMAAIGGSSALGQTLLSEIPIEGGWEPLLVGTVYEGWPLQTLTLDEVAGVIDPAVLAELNLGSLTFGNTGLSDLSIASMMLGDVPLNTMCGNIDATNCDNESVLFKETSGTGLASVPMGAIPMAAIPMGAIGDLASAPMGAIPMAAIPMGAIPMGAIDIGASLLSPVPMGAIANLTALPMAAIDPTGIPMAAIPMAAIPMGAIPIGAIGIGSIPIGAIGGGCAGDVDCSFAGVDDSTTVDEYLVATGSSDIALSPMAAIPIGEIPMGAIPMGAIDLDTVLLADVPMAAITTDTPLGYVTIGDINLSQADPDDDIDGDGDVDVDDVCDPSTGAPEGCSANTTLSSYASSLTASGKTLADTPMAAIPMAAIDASSVPMAAIADTLDSTQIAGLPMGAIKLTSIDLAASEIGNIEIGELGLPSGTTICGSSDPSLTLLEAAAQNSCGDATIADISSVFGSHVPEITLGDVLNHLTLGFLAQLLEVESTLPADAKTAFGGLTYGEIVVAILLAIDFPWEEMPLEKIETRDIACGFDLATRTCTQFEPDPADASEPDIGEPDIVDLSVGFDVVGGPFAGEAVDIEIPFGWTFIPGSAQVVDSDGVLVTAIADPAQEVLFGGGDDVSPIGRRLTFTTPVLQAAPSYGLEVAIAPGLELGSGFQVSADSHDGLTSAEPLSFAVVEGLEFNDPVTDTPGNALDLLEDHLYFGFINEEGDEDWWNIAAPPPGNRVAVYLSNLAGDIDTFVYRPETFPIGSDTAKRDIPLSIQPFDDDDVYLGGGGTLSPELLGDSPFVEPAGNILGDGSANRGEADEFAEFYSRDSDTGDDYTIQVAGFQGATSSSPYVLRVNYRPEVPTPTCSPRPNIGLSADTLPSIPSDVDTIFLANFDRMEALYEGESAAVRTALEGLANDNVGGVPVNGVVVPIESIPGIAETTGLFAQWDENPCDSSAANAIADKIISFVQDIANSHPSLRHVAIIGGDEQVPFARLDDESIVANESTYTEGFDDNALFGAHFTRHYLSDAPYGDLDPIPWLDRFAYIKDLGVGRLVESPSDIIGAIDTFVTNNGVLDPQTAATAGYDFLTDGAQSVKNNLSGLQDVDAAGELISESPDNSVDPHWTDQDLANIAYGASSTTDPAADVISPNAHYDHHRLLPANENFQQTENDLFTIANVNGLATGELQRRIVFTMGCHSGLSVDDTAGGNDQPEDWAQVYGAQRAVYIGNTGYGYGDTATVALSEQMMANVAAGLGNGQTIAQVLSQAGQDQFGKAGLYGVYDLKAIEEATLYGLPMWRVNVAGASPITGNGSDTGPVLPDSQTGLLAAPFSKSPDFGGGPISSPDGDYFAADGGTQFMHWRPITPKTEVGVTQDGLIATGAVLTDLVSRDEPLPNPVFARPNTTDQAGREPEVEFEDIIFPTTFATLGTFELLNPDRSGDPTTNQQSLNLLAGQYVGVDDTSTQRLFDRMDGQVYYVPEGSAVDWTPPSILDVEANVSGGNVGFLVEAEDPGSGISRVVVLYRSSEEGNVSDWTAVDLIPIGNNEWAGGGDTTIAQPDFIVQALNGDGVVGTAVFKGDFYQAELIPDDPTVNQAPDVGEITAPTDPVQLGTEITASATVNDDGSLKKAVWSWGDGTQTVIDQPAVGLIEAVHLYDAPGVYRVRLVVIDDGDLVGESVFEFVVIYDPDGGFVTGGGWIESPAGAYTADPSLTGKALFGFISKYQKGKTVPQGNTTFKFHTADLDFRSTEYEWLVISGEHKAQYKGTGTINGSGNYGFILTAIDAEKTERTDTDLFRIKIWWEDEDGTEDIVYDNELGADDDADPNTAIAGGSIVIHSGKNGPN